MSTAIASNREELMFLGKECHHPSCHLNDFLPFSCPACHLSYCQPHFLPSHHSCTSPLPKSMQDRIAPQCPLCNSVVPSVSTGDPNEAVEKHLDTGTCTGLEGGEARRKELLRQKKDKGEVCWRKGCAKTLVVKIKCDSCNHLFCPIHRSTTAHTCSNASTPSSSRGSTPQPPVRSSGAAASTPASNNPSSRSNLKPLASRTTPPTAVGSTPPANPTQPITAALDAKTAAASAALRRAGQGLQAPIVKHKVDKRTKDQLNSSMQALKVRHEKGLLSKDEEIKYADIVGKKESTRRKGESGKKDCVIG